MLNNKKILILILIIIIFIISCSKEDKVPNDTTSSKKWEGPIISFIKKDEANPTDKNNQDSITANVIITRVNDGGQIFNIVQEKSSDKYKSPIGTEWAIGTLDQIDSLTFESFRSTVNPQSPVENKRYSRPLSINICETDFSKRISPSGDNLTIPSSI